MHADGPRAVGPHGKPVEASASTTAAKSAKKKKNHLDPKVLRTPSG